MPFPDLAPDEPKETMASAAYERLRQEILTVAIQPGQKLTIRALCDRFGVGLSPMREALSRLSTEGLVSQSDHRGFAVTGMSEDDLADLTRARCALNELAIRQSIANGDAAWEESVVLAYHRLTRTPRFEPGHEDARSPLWETAHRNFHASLNAACNSRRIAKFCEDLFDSSERYRHVGRMAGVKTGDRDNQHRALMEAVVARDADTAGRLIRAHFEHTAERVRAVLKERGL